MRRIAVQADRLPAERLTAEKVIVRSNDELKALSVSFNKMVENQRNDFKVSGQQTGAAGFRPVKSEHFRQLCSKEQINISIQKSQTVRKVR